MLTTVIFLATMTVAGLLFILLRVFSWKRILWAAIPIDITFSILMLIAGSGSLTGLAVAVTASVMLSVILWLGKRSQGAAKALTLPKSKWRLVRVED